MVWLFLALACSPKAGEASTAAAWPAAASSGAPETPVTDPAHAQGAPLTPPEGLLDWLAGQAKGALVQLPVVLTLHPAGSGVTAAHVGVTAGPPGPQVVQLQLDTGALGISLTDQVASYCDGASCVVWLEGTWGALLGELGPPGPPAPGLSGPPDLGPPGPPTPGTSLGGPPGPEPTVHPFAVRRVIGPVEPGTTHARLGG